METKKTALQSAAKSIDEISRTAMEAFASPESFEKELAVASAVTQLRDILTQEVMKEVLALMNTSLGFDTDRNPIKTPVDKDGKQVTPYPVEVVRDIFIESRLRGFHVIGKEFSIIAGNFYAGVNGLERIVRTNKKLTNFRDTYEVPRSVAGGEGALVKCKAEWLQFTGPAAPNSGQPCIPQVLEREFAIRVNKGQGADAILGKAKRKLMAAVLTWLTGTVTPDGEVDEPLSLPKGEPTKSDELFAKQSPAPAATAPESAPQTDLGLNGEVKKLKK
jgi:hypothetical protein